MGDRADPRRQHAHRGVRPRGAARLGRHHHARPLSIAARVVLYGAAGCHLCERARSTIVAAQDELGFELSEIDITGNAELEARYREWLPVVEIGGERSFVYYVDADAFRRKVAAQTAASDARL